MPLLDKQRTKKLISVSVNVKIAILQVFGKDVGSKYIACKYLPVMFCFFLQWEGNLAKVMCSTMEVIRQVILTCSMCPKLTWK